MVFSPLRQFDIKIRQHANYPTFWRSIVLLPLSLAALSVVVDRVRVTAGEHKDVLRGGNGSGLSVFVLLFAVVLVSCVTVLVNSYTESISKFHARL